MTIEQLTRFLENSPTAWHAVDEAKEMLSKEGFKELFEHESWKLESGGKYFVVRNGSSLAAFTLPTKKPKTLRIAASHTDSPALKLKPNSEFVVGNMTMLGVEIYGSPLLTSWFNRDLGIAGRVVFLNAKGVKETALVNLIDYPVTIPQLAIHLDRSANETGPTLNKQDHLSALACINDKKGYLEDRLHEVIKFTKILSSDLFLYPVEVPTFIGPKKEMLAGYRIDSLVSVHAALKALLAQKPDNHQIKMVVLWDNEEVGSNSCQGAGSPFLPQILERISIALELSREEQLQLLSQSLCASVDLAHGVHPNYPEKHDVNHRPLLNKGIVLKHNAQQRYATDASSATIVVEICHKHDIPLQHFVSRNDMPCGTTIGPISANLTGISTVDIGCPQLSMHSCRELTGCKDYLDMCRFLEHFLAYGD